MIVHIGSCIINVTMFFDSSSEDLMREKHTGYSALPLLKEVM